MGAVAKAKAAQQPEGAAAKDATAKDFGSLFGAVAAQLADVALNAAAEALASRIDSDGGGGGGGGLIPVEMQQAGGGGSIGGGGGGGNMITILDGSGNAIGSIPLQMFQNIEIPPSALPSAGVKPPAGEQLPPGEKGWRGVVEWVGGGACITAVNVKQIFHCRRVTACQTTSTHGHSHAPSSNQTTHARSPPPPRCRDADQRLPGL
jgi:hypothetical protein